MEECVIDNHREREKPVPEERERERKSRDRATINVRGGALLYIQLKSLRVFVCDDAAVYIYKLPRWT